MRPNARIVVVAVSAAAVLAACGSSSGSTSADTSKTSKPSAATGSGSGSGSKKKIDVCKIIPASDAEKVIGGPVEQQAPAGTEGLSSGVCIYKATGGGIRVSLLQIRVYPGPQFYGEQALGNTTSIDVPGTDKAFERTAAGGKTIDVQFVKDDQTGTINFTDTGSTGSPSALADLQAIAAKLAKGI
jgi:hypothetical protein